MPWLELLPISPTLVLNVKSSRLPSQSSSISGLPGAAAPGSPEIDEDCDGSLEDFTFKTSVGEIGNSSSQGTQMTELILWKAGRLSWVDQSLSMDRFKSSSSASTSSTCTGFTASEASEAVKPVQVEEVDAELEDLKRSIDKL